MTIPKREKIVDRKTFTAKLDNRLLKLEILVANTTLAVAVPD